VTFANVPSAPPIQNAQNGAAGGAITANARWNAATANGTPVTGYVVTALRMSGTGATATVLGTSTSATQPAGARNLNMTLPQIGIYRFTVRALSAVGPSAESARSNAVTGQ
jgi:hypothetical protein